MDHPGSPAKTWGSLELREQIGAGAFGTVYRAKDTHRGRDVALKLYHAWRLDPSRQITQIIEEGRRLAHVHQRNLVTIYGVEHHRGQIGLWMEFIEGSTLERILVDQGPLSPDEAMVIGRDVCRALAALHDSGAIHRDIKATNVMREPGGRTVLMDLGVSCAVNGEDAARPLGTPLYAAPEVFLQDESTHRSDLYSVGVLLFHLATGSFPVAGQTLAEIRWAHRNRADPSRQERWAQTRDLPDSLIRIMVQALAPEPDQRYTSAAQFEAALVEALGEKARSFDVRGTKLPSVAILPFEDRSPRGDHDYLCEGLAAGVINKLSHLEGLHVVARASSFAFKGRRTNLADLGHALRVGAVLLGEIRQTGERFQISSRLVDVTDGRCIWSREHDCTGAKVVTLEGGIAVAVAENLRADFAEHEKERMTKANTGNVEAYDLNLKALYLRNLGTRSDLDKAIEYYQLAITRDPRYASAYVGLAECYSFTAWGEFFSGKGSFEIAKVAARKAIELNPMLADAHGVIGLIELAEWNWAAAERSALLAIDINPQSVAGSFAYAHYLLAVGRLAEAIDVMNDVLKIDPLSCRTHDWLSVFYLRSRQLKKAREHLHFAHQLQSADAPFHIVLGQVFLLEKNFDAGLAELRTAVDLWQDESIPLAALGWGYAFAGRESAAREILAVLHERRRSGNTRPYLLAKLHGGLGERDHAFEWLATAVQERDVHLISIKTDETLDNLRGDRRYLDILQQMNLEP